MTSITTMEEFEALDLGTIISVGGTGLTYEKVEAGWSRNGVTLDGLHFSGEVAEQRVMVGVRPQAGQVWSDEGAPNWGYSHLLVQQDATNRDQWWAIRMYEGQFNSIRRITVIPGKVLTENPPWYQMAWSMARNLVALQIAQDNYATQARDAVTGLTRLRSNMQSGLHSLVGAHAEVRAEVNALLTANEMVQAPEMVPVTAKVRVRQYVRVPIETVGSLLNVEGAVMVDTQESLATFTLDLTRQVQTVGGQCACSGFQRQQARAMLTEAGQSIYDVSIISRSCPNHEGEPDPF